MLNFLFFPDCSVVGKEKFVSGLQVLSSNSNFSLSEREFDFS